MEMQPDFRELLKLFNDHQVEYVIVGAFALAYYGCPRYTGDLDLLVNPDTPNAEKILSALKAFGFASGELALEDFTLPDNVIQLGVPPVRIDILTSRTGVGWKDVAQHRVQGNFGELEVPIIGKEEFIANKKALGRHKDIADIEEISR